MARNSVAVLKILELLGEGDPLGLSDLAAHLVLPKTSVHRALADLVEEGWVRGTNQSPARYFLSGKVLRVAGGANGMAELTGVAGPIMDRLQQATGENVQLATLEDGFVLALERRESRHTLRVHLPIGESLPWYATAVGRAIAGHLSPEQQDRLFSMDISALTPFTTVKPAELREQISKAATDGYVVNRSGWRVGVVSVGAAILDPRGKPIGGLSVNIVESRLAESDMDQLGVIVRDAAREISANLA